MANNNTRLYANTAKDVARNTGVAFINLYDEIESRINSSPSSSRKPFGGYEDYLVDGVRLSAGGNDLLYKLIVDAVNSTWPEIMPGLAPGPAGPTSSIPLQPAST
ncbi:hypothetical protein GGF46_005011 [Coemansia sp. RSA 552]|nr:hypothetical protein GGF46_005011 [Coemansia sp. RSA 552]